MQDACLHSLTLHVIGWKSWYKGGIDFAIGGVVKLLEGRRALRALRRLNLSGAGWGREGEGGVDLMLA